MGLIPNCNEMVVMRDTRKSAKQSLHCVDMMKSVFEPLTLYHILFLVTF